jgi:hypothetical protein
MAAASIGLSEFENELLPEPELESEYESEFELESPEAFGWGDIKKATGDVASWAGSTWRNIQTPGTNARRIAIDTAKSALKGGISTLAKRYLGSDYGGLVGDIVGGGLTSALAPPSLYENEAEFESELEISPTRKIYPDAMLEHIAHEALQSESEQEAAEHMLPMVPMVAGKLVPLAARATPQLAANVLPRIARAQTSVIPYLTRAISNITRTLFRNPQTRPLVRTVPSIARRTMAQIARLAAAGRPVSPQAAVQILARQTYRLIANPRQSSLVLRRSNALDRRFHGMAGIPWRPAYRR